MKAPSQESLPIEGEVWRGSAIMEKYQLQKLRDLPIEGVAERLGLRVERHKCLCPFHDDHRASLTFKNNKFKCWACGESGDTISLAKKVLGKDFREACRWLANENNVILTEYKPSETKPPKPFDAKRYEKYFERPFLNAEARRFLFEERKLDERVVRWCRLNSFRDKQGIPWLQIPYYDQQGKLVGIQNRNLQTPSNSPSRGRNPSEESLPLEGEVWRGSEALSSPPNGGVRGGLRFRFPRGSRCGIYNLPVLSLLKPGEDLYIAEGCSDCWALLSAGHKAIAIPSATLLTNDVRGKMEEVRGKFDIQFHMWPDRDAPGERLFLQLQKVLPSLQHHQLPPDCKDVSDLYVKGQIQNSKLINSFKFLEL
jgi:hypothetical protein